jgi:hypothetical protein
MSDAFIVGYKHLHSERSFVDNINFKSTSENLDWRVPVA